MEAIIETSGLKKTYGKQIALQGLDLKIPKGSICGFLGRNGAGKTTTLKILLGMARASQGSARVFGLVPDDVANGIEIRRRVGFVSENKELYPCFTVRDMINFARPLYTRWRSDLEEKYLKIFELVEGQKVSKLSKGTRTKLMLLLALCHEAELLILDEPTDGLDPVMVEEVLRLLVARAAEDGATVFFSSHQLHEVEQIADYITIIHEGRQVISGYLDDLKTNFRRVNMVFENDPPAPAFAQSGATSMYRNGRTMSLLASHGVDEIVRQAHSMHAASVEVETVSLKEIFLNVAKPGGAW